MITIAILSNGNSDILKTLHDALVICGVRSNTDWNKHYSSPAYMTVSKSILYYMHYPVAFDERITLTREPFGDVLNFVLLCQIWEEN